MTEKINLSKYLGQSGALSRRAAAEAVKAGRVCVNQQLVLEPGTLVELSAQVCLDGRPVAIITEHTHLLLNKPVGCASTKSDAFAKQTVFDFLPKPPPAGLTYAGRLDVDSEGFLLFSTNGDLINKISHPKFEVWKCYFVQTLRPITATLAAKMQSGVQDDGEFLQPKAVFLHENGVIFILNEGKKREIRRLVAAVAHTPITLLRRLSTGKLALGNLKLGSCRPLSAAEMTLAATPKAIPESLARQFPATVIAKLKNT